MAPQAWLRIAGIGTWLVASLPALVAISQGALPARLALLWGIAFAGFGLAFILSTCVPGASRPLTRLLLIVQAVCGLALAAITRDGFAAATLVVVAGQLLWDTSLRVALVWVALQTAALFAIFWWEVRLVAAVSAAGAYGGFQLFAVAAAALAIRERRTVDELARTNAELTATRELLAENSRAAERVRISRDLHDTLGHHLTALSLQLDVASRLSTGPANEHITQAHAIARLLLSDVRDVVSRLRDQGRADLAPALRALAARVAMPAVELRIPGELLIDDPARAHALLRTVQEIITNAVKHSGAAHLWISVERTDDAVVLEARDDGRGSDSFTFGNGLTGMRERFMEYGGRIDITSSNGSGFTVRGFLPLMGPPA